MKSTDVRLRGDEPTCSGHNAHQIERAGERVLILGRRNDGCAGSGSSIPTFEEARMMIELLIQGGLVHDEFRIGDGDRRRSGGVFGVQGD